MPDITGSSMSGESESRRIPRMRLPGRAASHVHDDDESLARSLITRRTLATGRTLRRDRNAPARYWRFIGLLSRKRKIAPASPLVASNRIFVCYRRDDTAYPSGWLFDKLAQHFGRDQVFKDIDSIQLGDDFAEVITTAVARCDVLLVFIGLQWLTITDEDGHRRLDNPHDFVRVEIETAIKRNVRIIPILVEGARMPHARRTATQLGQAGAAASS